MYLFLYCVLCFFLSNHGVCDAIHVRCCASGFCIISKFCVGVFWWLQSQSKLLGHFCVYLFPQWGQRNGQHWNMESGIRKRKRKRNTESNINDSKLKNFSLHNLSTIQREFVLVFLAVPLNIFLLLCLDKVCRSVGYCTARPMKVILRVIFIHEFMGWIIQLNITFVANCQE